MFISLKKCISDVFVFSPFVINLSDTDRMVKRTANKKTAPGGTVLFSVFVVFVRKSIRCCQGFQNVPVHSQICSFFLIICVNDILPLF